MDRQQIAFWLKNEFLPVKLATEDETVLQNVDNAIRYFNTHSAYKITKMFPAAASTVRVALDAEFKNVAKVYPATTPDWILGNYPLWSLLGITIIDNLTSDLIMLSEAYRNYRYYMGADFNFHWEPAENPYQIYPITVANESVAGISGTLAHTFLLYKSLVITNGTETLTETNDGILTSSLSGGRSGTINRETGAWTITGALSGGGAMTATYQYDQYPDGVGGWLYLTNLPNTTTKIAVVGTKRVVEGEDITNDYILQWVQYYAKALTKMAEGNTLRKASAINISNDGQQLMDEGKEEKLALEEKLAIEGRWFAFVRRM